MAFNTGMAEYQDACQRQDWEILETKRFQVTTALEGLLDSVASAHKLMGLPR
jgi:phosphoribosyl-dephospho-CoA transferase